MRAVVQRVTCAKVTIDDRVAGEIGAGLMVLLGVAVTDDEIDATWMAEKIAHLRVFTDEEGLMNRSIVDTHGAVLLVSQFTLHGDARKGRRPSFITAAPGDIAEPLFERTLAALHALGLHVAYGEFGADVQVDLTNNGPVTILLDSKRTF